MNNKTMVIAVGGNALIKDNEHTSIKDQYEVVKETVKPLIELIKEGWNLIITHGNGPQVGFILRRSELSLPVVPPVPMDYAGADIQGAVGYMFNKAFRNSLKKVGISKNVVTVISEVVVDINDPNFKTPNKPIGSYMTEEDAKSKAKEYNWQVMEDAGRGWRRVVASPKPKEIVELSIIEKLSNDDNIVITCGGGGIPVFIDDKDDLVGIEAVIDKDLTSALLATQLKVDVFVIATSVEKVAIKFGTPQVQWLDTLNLEKAKLYLGQNEFHKGSMEPKVKAIINFVETTGKKGLITNLESLPNALKGKAGTHFIK